MRLMLTAGTAALLFAVSAMAQPATEPAPVPDTAPSAVTNPEPSADPNNPPSIGSHPDTTAPAPETTPVPDNAPAPETKPALATPSAPVNDNAITTRESAKAPAPQDRSNPLSNVVRAPSNPAVKTTDGNNPGAPFAGANSFTAGQAKSRIEARGYNNVSPLTKDQEGIWRGKAEKEGKTFDISLDYQGNVVVR